MSRTSLSIITTAALATAGAVLAFAAHQRTKGRRRVASTSASPAEVARRHAAKVERIAARLREHRSGPVSLSKRVVSHQVPKRGDLKYSDGKLDIRDLTEILHVDPERRICVAESGVTFEDLVAATLPYGLVPMVVPEFKTITIGGAVSGCSIESTSFRHGGFHDTCIEYEVVTGGGEVLRCTPDNEHALIFHMLHGAFGTLGVLTRLTFRLMPARQFVRMTYEKFTTLPAYVAAIRERMRRPDIDFLDGIIHTPEEFVLCIGRYADEAPYTNRYDWLEVYYPTTRTRAEDYLRTADYLFRYDRGVTNVWAQGPLRRALIGKLVGSDNMLRLARLLRGALARKQPTVTLDVFIPAGRVREFWDMYTADVGHFPLWCVPYRRVQDYAWISPQWYAGLGDEDLFLDLAIYGMHQRPGQNVHRDIERMLPRVNGIKTLISHNYYSEEEFWSVWDLSNYQRVKARTDPGGVFRGLYDKTCRAARGLA